MSNEDQINQSTEFESETNSEEPPSFEKSLDVLDRVFDNNNDGIDAEKLLADAEIDFSEFLQRVQCQMEQYSKTNEHNAIAVTPLERLDEIDLDFSRVTPFFSAAWNACRSIPPGETRSYSWLAAEAGSPLAMRAAGQAMARNRFSLIIPCHRVIASDGGLGGYGGGGLGVKAQLLQMELNRSD